MSYTCVCHILTSTWACPILKPSANRATRLPPLFLLRSALRSPGLNSFLWFERTPPLLGTRVFFKQLVYWTFQNKHFSRDGWVSCRDFWWHVLLREVNVIVCCFAMFSFIFFLGILDCQFLRESFLTQDAPFWLIWPAVICSVYGFFSNLRESWLCDIYFDQTFSCCKFTGTHFFPVCPSYSSICTAWLSDLTWVAPLVSKLYFQFYSRHFSAWGRYSTSGSASWPPVWQW